MDGDYYASTSSDDVAALEQNAIPRPAAFKESFKHFKSKVRTPDFSAVVDLLHADKWPSVLIKFNLSVNLTGFLDTCSDDFQLRKELPAVYCLSQPPGLLLIRNPFADYGHLYWSQRFLKNYTSPSVCRTNLGGVSYEGDIFASKHVLKQVRWASLGYHYDWTQKTYSESDQSKFPEELGRFCRFIANICGFPHFQAEAAILNFYHLDSTLSGHVDRSEWNLDAPLISFSFGQSAIFLLGGTSLDEPPLPLLLRSGDIMIMSAKSRLCYHAVPRIIQDATFQLPVGGLNDQFQTDDEVDPRICDYLNANRVNATIRQMN